jgi:hypothetical protein
MTPKARPHRARRRERLLPRARPLHQPPAGVDGVTALTPVPNRDEHGNPVEDDWGYFEQDEDSLTVTDLRSLDLPRNSDEQQTHPPK